MASRVIRKVLNSVFEEFMTREEYTLGITSKVGGGNVVSIKMKIEADNFEFPKHSGLFRFMCCGSDEKEAS